MDTKLAGKRGGNKTLKLHGKKHFSKISKDAWSRRNAILSQFNIGDLENPVTKKSITVALENADKEHD